MPRMSTVCVNPDCPRPEGTPVRAAGLCDSCFRKHPELKVKPPSVTDAYVREIAEAVRNGATIAAYVQEHGGTPQGVNAYIARHPHLRPIMDAALGTRAQSTTVWDAKRQKEVATVIARGGTLSDAARDQGVDPSTLHKALDRLPEFKDLVEKAKAAAPPRRKETQSYVSPDRKRMKFTERSAEVLEHVIEVGKVYCTERPDWQTNLVTSLARGNLATVTWTRANMTGSWTVVGVTEFGREQLAKWRSTNPKEK